MDQKSNQKSNYKLDQLSRELGVSTGRLSFLEDLDENEISVLLDGFSRAKTGQKRSLNDSIDRSLGHIPFLLRGPVKAILLGGSKI